MKRFHTPRLQKKQKGTFANYLHIFLLVRNVFLFKKLYQNEIKTFQIAPEFFKDKENLLAAPKKIRNVPEQKLLDQDYLAQIESVLF
jgi:hypothetical protein